MNDNLFKLFMIYALIDWKGEDARAEVLREMRRVVPMIDGFVVFSEFYRDFMAELLHIPLDRFRLVPMGL